MFRLSVAIAFMTALGAAGATLADAPPGPPDDTMPDACRPLMGNWTAKAPEADGDAKVWTTLSVSDSTVIVVDYRVFPDRTQTTRGTFDIDCQSGDAGAMTLTLTKRQGDLASHQWVIALKSPKEFARTVPAAASPNGLITYELAQPLEFKL